MASSRSLNSPEAELRHWLQDLLLETPVEVTTRSLRCTTHYTLTEVSLGGLTAVALKANESSLQIQGERDPAYASITEKIADECHRFAKLRHPNIIQFLGVSFPKESLLPLLVMEHLEVSLTQCLHRFNNLPDPLKISIIFDISLGLQCLHDSSLVHGNVIASNVLLTPSLTAKLTYPTIYTTFGDNETQVASNGDIVHQQKDCRDDIFALGDLMVFVITQRRPKRSVGYGNSPSLVQQIEHVDKSHGLRGLIMQCLQKDAILRPSILEVVQEVKSFITTKKTPYQDPMKFLETTLQKPSNLEHSITSALSPKDSKLKKLETENARLHAQLKVTQSELRHLRVQQTLFGKNSTSESDTEDEDEGSDNGNRKSVEVKDASVQVDILQVNHQKVYIELHKETSEQSLGFSIAGGKGASLTFIEGDQSVFVTRIAPGGLAETDGRLKPRDKLVSVNGVDLTNATRAEALTALMNAGNVCAIVIERQEISAELDNSLSMRRFTSSSSSRKRRPSKSKLHPLKLGVSIAFEECSSLPKPLSGGQAVTYKNKIIVGGHYSADSSALYEYDPETDTWSTLTHSPSMWFFGLTVFQDKLTLIGGFNTKTQDCSSKIFSLNEREGSWLGSLPSMPTPRMHSTSISLGSSLVVAGGRNNRATLNCIEVFNFSSQQWYTAHPLTVEQSSMRSLCQGGFWYLLGGEQQGFPTSRVVYTQLQSLIDSAFHKTGSVSCFKAIRGLPNIYSAVALNGGKIIAIGGKHATGSEASSMIYALCEDPFSWLEVGELPVPLSNACAIPLSDDEVLIIGGCTDDGKDTDFVYRLYLQETTTQKKDS